MSFDLLPFDSASNDQDITTRVRLALGLCQRLTLRSIALEVSEGAVTLRGTVPTFFDRQVAFETTRHVAGVRQVHDELQVQAAAPPVQNTKPAVFDSERSPFHEESPMQSRSLHTPAQSRSFLWGTSVAVMMLILGVATGCGDGGPKRLKVHPVSGKITLDSAPLPNAMVVLHPKDKSNPLAIAARAQTDAEGNFKVSTYDVNDGAPAGDYAVTVLFYKATETADGIVPGPNLLSPAIATPETTDIQVTVAEGPNELKPIEVRR